ncbi:MAG: hypothetical protein KAT65_15555, partial [Methanophagales archaeon]|nr:hypothetical protein [Methanophagales archaeon]
MKRLFYVSLAVLSLTLLFLSVGIASAQQDVLRLDVDKSYIINLDTGGTKTYYKDFLNTEQLEGHKLEFHIYVNKVEKAYIPDEYVLKLETNLEGPPEWKFGDDFRRSAEWMVWKGKEEHELQMRPIILTGEVPKPIIPVEEPGFEAYKETKGIGKREVYVKLTVGTTKDGATLESIIQPLEPSMEFFSTSEGIQDAESVMKKNLEEARGKIGRTDLEEDIWGLYEKGHPGWASKLSAHYKELIMERFENYRVEVEEPTEFWVEVSNPAGAYICNDTVDITFGRNLKHGDKVDAVKYLQIVLNANPATQVAVDGPG